MRQPMVPFGLNPAGMHTVTTRRRSDAFGGAETEPSPVVK